jgi:transcriptional regulator with XRE-family HTH domain
MKRAPYVERFRSFPCLVGGLLHRTPPGTVQAMADRTQIDHATLSKWMRGRTKQPPPDLVRQWARAMEVPEDEALALCREDQWRRLQGEPVPLPDLSHLRPGPPPRKDSIRSLRKLRKLIPIRGGSANDGTLPVLPRLEEMPLIGPWVKLAREWWWATIPQLQVA